MALLIALHILAAVVWVGGMFFAYMVLRPASGPLPPEERLALWCRVFDRFFPFVWASIVLLLVTGYGMISHLGGLALAPLHVHVMQVTGIVMILLFLHLFFAPWRRFRAAIDRRDFGQAGRQLGQIRLIVAANLVLGLITIVVGASGRF